MSGDTNRNGGKRNFYPVYAKEHLTAKTADERKKRWIEKFIKENLFYYRRLLKYYVIFVIVFIFIVILAYKIY